jgi:hypothetical protein
MDAIGALVPPVGVAPLNEVDDSVLPIEMETDEVLEVPPVSAEDEDDEGVNYYCCHVNLQALYDKHG